VLSIGLLALVPHITPLPFRETLSLISIGLLHTILGCFAIPCSISVLKSSTLHSFVHEQFGFLDVLLLRGFSFSLLGCNLLGSVYASGIAAGIEPGHWIFVMIQVLAGGVGVAGLVLAGLHFHHEGERGINRDDARYPMNFQGGQGRPPDERRAQQPPSDSGPVLPNVT